MERTHSHLAENKAAVRRIIDDLWNGWDLSIANDLYAPNYIDHTHGPADPPGLEGFARVFDEWRAAFPDWHIAVESLIGEGDRVVALLSASGTHVGSYHGVPPSGGHISTTAIEMWRFADGKVVEFWAYYDEINFFRQLGKPPADGE